MKYKYSDVTFIIPSRENLHFLKFAYDSIRRNIGNEPYILCADDFSVIDGSKFWMEETKKTDDRFDFIVNSGPERLGHVILFNLLVERVKTKLFVLSHADMVWLKGSLDGLLNNIQPKRIVSATRCEPSIHPPEPCKISLDWLPSDPAELDEDRLQNYVESIVESSNVHETKGIFAPYLMETSEYLSIGGCDYTFRPTSREDDDLWNRLLLNGCEFVQSWKSFVFHRSCAGSRWNPTLTKFGQNSTEWAAQQSKSLRNFIRKWKSVPLHDKWHHPITPNHLFNIAFKISNCTLDFLHLLEPWADEVWTDLTEDLVVEYIKSEQSNTPFELSYKIDPQMIKPIPDITIEIDRLTFGQREWEYVQNLQDIIDQSGDIGEFELGNLKIAIRQMKHYELDLIRCKNEKIELN